MPPTWSGLEAGAGVVGEVDELDDGVVDPAISVQLSFTDNIMKNRGENIQNENAEETHF